MLVKPVDKLNLSDSTLQLDQDIINQILRENILNKCPSCGSGLSSLHQKKNAKDVYCSNCDFYLQLAKEGFRGGYDVRMEIIKIGEYDDRKELFNGIIAKEHYKFTDLS